MSLPAHFTLNNGKKISSVGLGTWQSQPGEVRTAVAHALKSGYRYVVSFVMPKHVAEPGLTA